LPQNDENRIVPTTIAVRAAHWLNQDRTYETNSSRLADSKRFIERNSAK
jgi:hypothetical protein